MLDSHVAAGPDARFWNIKLQRIVTRRLSPETNTRVVRSLRPAFTAFDAAIDADLSTDADARELVRLSGGLPVVLEQWRAEQLERIANRVGLAPLAPLGRASPCVSPGP